VTKGNPLPLIWGLEQLRNAIDTAGVALWAWNVDDDQLTMDERAFELWGVPISELVTFEELSSHIHPADRDRVRAAFAATRAVVGPCEIDFRILIGDDVRPRKLAAVALANKMARTAWAMMTSGVNAAAIVHQYAGVKIHHG
jgi:PAS domain-containing protein